MFGALIGAFARLISWLLGAGSVKWVLASVLVFGGTLLFDLLLDLFPAWFGMTDLTGATAVFTPEIWYFIDYFNLQLGLSLTFSAWATRFLIRRLPVIG